MDSNGDTFENNATSTETSVQCKNVTLPGLDHPFPVNIKKFHMSLLVIIISRTSSMFVFLADSRSASVVG